MRKNPSAFNALGFFYWGFSSFNVMNNGKFDSSKGVYLELEPQLSAEITREVIIKYKKI
ncbi:hypothetical protein [Photobacterium damselae]|uniref:hypothetical protein n=1 Tax=Photobacterium damselae TaxID=38293 RepID=UPI0014872EB5|nr:hypothetical protein [Photobacterium damselae]